MTVPTASPRRLLSVTTAAAELDCSRGHIYNLIAAGVLTAVEIKATGNRSKTRIRATDLDAFIDARTQPHPGRGGST